MNNRIETPPPSYPFQHISTDYFEVGHHSYLVIVDRFSGWLIIYHFHYHATSKKLISICRELFATYGVSEELDSDGGPQFPSHEFEQFLNNWSVKHRQSSARYPQSNGRAELGVKSAKRIIMSNTNSDGSLDNDAAARAVLQYRNTPIPEVGLSPAQLLLHRQLRDSIPANPKHLRLHKNWVISAEERERAFASRNKELENNYNRHASNLNPIQTQTPVRVQENGSWTKTGKVVEILPHRRYRIRMDGSGRLTIRNRRFIKEKGGLPFPSPDIPDHNGCNSQNKEEQHWEPSTTPTHTDDQQVAPKKTRLPRMLKNIAPHNNKGIREETDEPRHRARLRGGKEF